MTGADRWIPLNDALTHVTKCVGSEFLAFVELKLALADGRIEETEERSHSIDGGNIEIRKLTQKFWQTAKLEQIFCDEYPHGHVAVTPGEKNRGRMAMYHYFVRQRYLQKLWPLTDAPAVADTEALQEDWPRKSAAGAKGGYDWDKIILRAVCLMLETTPETLTELKDQILARHKGKAPGDTQLKNRLRPFHAAFRAATGK